MITFQILYLIATFRVCLYVLFQRAFAAPIYGPFFDPAAPFMGVPLYMAHPDPITPHQARPPAAPPPPVHPESSKSDPLEMTCSSSSSSSAPDDCYAPAGLGFADLMPNGFLSLESVQWSLLDFGDSSTVQGDPILGVFCKTFGHKHSFDFFLFFVLSCIHTGLKCPYEDP